MNEDLTGRTQRVAQRYFDAWTNRRTQDVENVLDPDFRFTGGDLVVEGRDAFLSAGAYPAGAKTTLIDEAYQGEIGFQLYEARVGDRSVRIAERLRVRDGRIVDSILVTDMAAFLALLSGDAGQGARA
jgi:hypothetical protein